MRSLDSSRSSLEQGLRVVSLGALAALAMRLWFGASSPDATSTVATSSLDSALASWSAAAPVRATVNATTVPGPAQRAWLVALRRTGTTVRWRTTDSIGGALVAEPAAVPGGVAHLTALGAPQASLTIADDLGRIDSAATGRTGVATWRVRPIGAVQATVSAATALAQPRDSLVVRPVLVVGEAGWEAKFVTAALEEDGWPVTARMRVAPAVLVRQGSMVPIDTATHSAIVVLDSTSTLDAGVLARFANDGGGVIASGAGVRHPALRSLLPRNANSTDGAVGALLGPRPREGLNARTFVASAGTVSLERRGDRPVVAGRRVGAGRVVVVGYDDTWRLRMTPPDEAAPGAHREWWTSLVGGVARARLLPRDAAPVDEAPLAATVDALGAPVPPGRLPVNGSRWPWDALLAVVAAFALLSEWLSRRLRGVA